MFINVLAIRDCDLTSIVKYADETTLLVKVNENETDLSQEVVNQFFSWTEDNAMACNPKKCNEMILCRKVAHDIDPVNNITQVSCLKVLGDTLQSNHRFNEHIKEHIKLQEANKCRYVIRCLRKERYQQPDVHYVFRSIVLVKLVYSLPIYASSIPELITVQNFLQHRFKRKYISHQNIDIYDALEEVDRSLFKKISSMPGHPLYPSVPKRNESSAHLRVTSNQLPRVNTQPFWNFLSVVLLSAVFNMCFGFLACIFS